MLCAVGAWYFALWQYLFLFFFFKDPAPPEISPLPLPAALPIPRREPQLGREPLQPLAVGPVAHHDETPAQGAHLAQRLQQSIESLLRHQAAHEADREPVVDRKSTRLNSSHSQISYAVFCLKKKK